MWILQYLPGWIFSAILILSVFGYLAAKFLPRVPQAKLLEYLSIFVAVLCVYMHGAVSNNESWLKRVSELELKVKEAELASTKVNTEIQTKVLTRTQVVKQKGETIVKYIDRETVKIDERCVIPKEFVEAHNQAATK